MCEGQKKRVEKRAENRGVVERDLQGAAAISNWDSLVRARRLKRW